MAQVFLISDLTCGHKQIILMIVHFSFAPEMCQIKALALNFDVCPVESALLALSVRPKERKTWLLVPNLSLTGSISWLDFIFVGFCIIQLYL